MIKFLKEKFLIIKYLFISKVSLFKKIFSKKDQDLLIIAPCVGDLVEYEDGTRSIVMSVHEDKDGHFDIRLTSNNIVKCVNKKGRLKTLVSVSEAPSDWPPEKCKKVLRDSKVIHPQKNWRIVLVNRLSSIILK